jgi:hypothetical protein
VIVHRGEREYAPLNGLEAAPSRVIFGFDGVDTKRRFQKDMKGAVNFMDMLLTLAI